MNSTGNFSPESFPTINELVLARNRRASDVVMFLTANLPAPRWLEDLLKNTRPLPGFDSVLRDIRNNPDKLMEFSTNMAVAEYYRLRGIGAQFLPSDQKKMPDLLLNTDTHAEVKTLTDTSLWPRLIFEVSRIKSDYDIWIETDFELLRPQLVLIIDEVRNQVTTSKSPKRFETKWADFSLIPNRGKGTRVLSIGMRGPVDLRGCGPFGMQVRAAALSQLSKASLQLAGYAKRIAFLDMQRHFGTDKDFLDEVFLGTQRADFASRFPDGVMSNWASSFQNVECIVVFGGLSPQRIYPKQGYTPESWLWP